MRDELCEETQDLLNSQRQRESILKETLAPSDRIDSVRLPTKDLWLAEDPMSSTSAFSKTQDLAFVKRGPTKIMTTPFTNIAANGTLENGHLGAGTDHKHAADVALHLAPGVTEFQNYERLVTQRDAKIGILQKQVDMLQASLREKGLEQAEKALSSLITTTESSNAELMRLQLELEEARKATEQERYNVEKLQKKQAEDVKEIRKMYEELVHENSRQQEILMQHEDTIRQKDEALLTLQHSYGQLEGELDCTVVKVSKLQSALSDEQGNHSKQAEIFHKTVLDHMKQLDAARKDRDNLSTELCDLKSVLAGHEGLVAKLQSGRRQEDSARERLMQELEAAQVESNLLRDEVVMLQSQVNTHKVQNKLQSL